MVDPYPFVSVVMVVKNAERYLGEAMQTVVAQGYRPMEIIVIDGQSVDQTPAIAQSISGVRFIQQKGVGLANARNEGIAAARGELIAFLDSDDRWVPDKLKSQVEYLKNHLAVDYVIANFRFFLQPGLELKLRIPNEMIGIDQVGYTPGTMLARRELFQKIGGFNEALSVGCDSDWFARLLDADISTKHFPEVMLLKRIHDNNLSFSKKIYKQELLTIIRQSIARKR